MISKLEAATTLTLTGFAMGAEIYGGPPQRPMQVLWNGGLIDTVTFLYAGQGPTTMGWQYHEYVLPPAIGADALTFASVTGGNYGPALDDVTLEPSVGLSLCFGDGSGTGCPCGNSGSVGRGCANGSGSGAILVASGTSSVTAGDLVLQGFQLITSQPCLYFQGDNVVAGGSGVVFGDGLRCAGGNVARLQVRSASVGGTSFSTVNIAALTGASAGQTKRYQIWYRDPAGPCGSGFNSSNGVELTWTP